MTKVWRDNDIIKRQWFRIGRKMTGTNMSDGETGAVADDDARISGCRREIGEVTRVSGHVRGGARVHDLVTATGVRAGRGDLLESGEGRRGKGVAGLGEGRHGGGGGQIGGGTVEMEGSGGARAVGRGGGVARLGSWGV
jgi:hypothetical protein